MCTIIDEFTNWFCEKLLDMNHACHFHLSFSFLSVGCMKHWESESDFELQEVDPGVNGLSDEPFETSSEEQTLTGSIIQVTSANVQKV